MKKILRHFLSLFVLLIVLFSGVKVGASAVVTGDLDVSWHIIPILKDTATAYTSISKPSYDFGNCASETTVKIKGLDGKWVTGNYSETGMTWDLPLNAGAEASTRGAKKAISTHKAKSFDTNYQWISTANNEWNK